MRNRRWRARSIVSRVVAAALVGALGLGVAAAASPDDRETTEAVLRDVEASPSKKIAKEMVDRSRAALARAATLRAAGDEPHARLADGLAKTWAEAARDVIRAVELEQKAHAARLSATDAGAVAERERALLEEGIAQTGRLRAQLEAVEREGTQKPARTSAAASSNGDGGSNKPTPQRRAPIPHPRDGGTR